ncbi:hypothetical protein F7Q92_11630 [Ideonella dechloratans]|uniref:TonB C-terminal domain-containing protein n=1 Tax=Ideonella dechloratans TaxID=36863 RepID=A0A643FEN2_IDEDE|nr:hypothetical protein F7Q92_11630 [Ideonella dechloratans]
MAVWPGRKPPLSPAPPRLPTAACRVEPTGKTTFHLVIDEDGHVLEAAVTTPSGPSHRQIDEAVLETLTTCQVRPLSPSTPTRTAPRPART